MILCYIEIFFLHCTGPTGAAAARPPPRVPAGPRAPPVELLSFLILYKPRQNVAVDERMVKSRHRSGLRQFNKDKPIRWGIKLWVLADSSNGYTIDFNVYIGKVAG